MQFIVTNLCPYPVAVFASNIHYSPKQLSSSISPQQILKKVAYDFYWHNKLTNDWAHHIRTNMEPFMTFYGFAGDNPINVYNITRVPQYLYVFYVKAMNKKVSLWYHLVTPAEYFNQFDNMAVYQYNINLNDAQQPNIVASSDASTGALLIDYYDPGTMLNSQEADWTPTLQPQTTFWQYPIIVGFLILLMILGIVIACVVLYSPSKESNLYITKNVEVIEKTS